MPPKIKLIVRIITLAIFSILLCSNNILALEKNGPEFSLEQKIGAMIMVGFTGTKITDENLVKVSAQIQKGQIGGVIFYGYNIESPEQVSKLNNDLKKLQGPFPIFIAVDQEGGKVQRLTAAKGFKDFLSAKAVAQNFSKEQALAHYKEMGEMLTKAGFNLNFAPVVDVDHAPPCPVIGGKERSYSATPSEVVKYGAAMVEGMHAAKVLSCLKHFPGHGSLANDTHIGLGDGTNTWQSFELIPFYELMQNNQADMIMTAHLVNKNIDPDYPATLSPTLLKTLLRDQGYDGVIVSDDLMMGAIMKNYDLKTVVISAINAGVDLLLFSNNIANAKEQKWSNDIAPEVIQIVLKALKDGEITEERINQSFLRLQTLKQRLANI